MSSWKLTCVYLEVFLVNVYPLFILFYSILTSMYFYCLFLLACVAGAKRGGRKARKRGKGRSLPLSPLTPSPFPFFPIPYPFRRLLRRIIFIALCISFPDSHRVGCLWYGVGINPGIFLWLSWCTVKRMPVYFRRTSLVLIFIRELPFASV